MKVNRIMMEYANYGLPTIEKKINENIAIHLWFNTFECGNKTSPFKKIKQIGVNLFAIESDFRTYNFCFKLKWYQFMKFYSYFYGKKIINFVKMMIE